MAALALLISACSTVQGDVQAGRQDLLYGDPNRALEHFERAAASNPNYLYYSVLPQSVWTYVGRAHYAAGKFPDARHALERAVQRSDQDNLARLYLGLTRVREGDREAGIKDVENGLRGVRDWLDYVERQFSSSYGRFWDPNRQIRSAIASDLAMISQGTDQKKLLAEGEWVGTQMEEEIDRARRDERTDHYREGEDPRR